MHVRPDGMVQLQGFPSKPRTASDGGLLASADAAEAAKAEELRRGLLSLSFAWVGSWNKRRQLQLPVCAHCSNDGQGASMPCLHREEAVESAGLQRERF